MSPRSETADILVASRAAIGEWLTRHDLATASIAALQGDLSTRSYFRIELAGESGSWIVARYPPELADAQRRFAAASALLAEAGVRVPKVRIDDPEAGFALVEDVGPSTLHERFASWAAAPRELESALTAADRIAALDRGLVGALGSPPLDESVLRRELAQTAEFLLAPQKLDRPELLRALDELCARLARAPLVACHRDFMARNLIPLGAGDVAVLDFQDLRLGPAGYDLASLLNDTLFASPELEARCVAAWPRLAGDPAQYRAAVVQRSLKAVGTYLAFARRGMRRHLPLVAPTLERALAGFAEVEATAVLAGEWTERIRAAGRAAVLC